MSRTIASLGLMVTILFAGLPATAMDAADWTSQGGAVDEPGRNSIDVWIGFPSVSVTAKLPIVRHLEIDPFAEVFYWGKINSTEPLVGTLLGARLKINVLDRGSLQMALMADLGVGAKFYPDTGFVLSLRFPQLVISGKVAEKVHVFGGMKVPIEVMVHPDFNLALTFAANVGAEFILTDKIHLWVMVEGGPRLDWNVLKNPLPGDESFSVQLNGWFSTAVGVAARF